MGSQPLQGDERSAKFAVASEQQETFAHASCAQRAMISNSACYIMACSLTYLQRRCGVRRFRPAGGTVCGVVACGLCLCLVGHDDDARPAPARRPSHLAVFPPRHHIFLILDHSRRSVRMMMYRDPRAYTFPKCVNRVENDSSTISKIRSSSLHLWRQSRVSSLVCREHVRWG
jgi:hypothetical protein